MTWQTLTPSDAVEVADWIGERLHPFAKDVGSVVPPGLPAYARIFHPASRSRHWQPEDVRWSEVAAWSGRTVHPEMQFHAIAVPATPSRIVGSSPWNAEPRLGVLSNPQCRALVGLLARFTTTPADCWFCLWEGYGYLTGSVRAFSSGKQGPSPAGSKRQPRWRPHLRFPRPIGNRPDRKRVRLPGRDYLLFRGPVAKAEGWEDGPNLWWPEDRAWCVASEIDFPYTYVAGSQELIDAILKDPAIESLPATDTDGINYSSDRINS
ncbi:MAG: hypothetical protein M3082_14755 [Candidatus Dormibacteraeota bacterium]|nr:hypothetical protein [Candidatus Dormibacteraeota bacterium]